MCSVEHICCSQTRVNQLVKLASSCFLVTGLWILSGFDLCVAVEYVLTRNFYGVLMLICSKLTSERAFKISVGGFHWNLCLLMGWVARLSRTGHIK